MQRNGLQIFPGMFINEESGRFVRFMTFGIAAIYFILNNTSRLSKYAKRLLNKLKTTERSENLIR